jgi:hypothetical protein
MKKLLMCLAIFALLIAPAIATTTIISPGDNQLFTQTTQIPFEYDSDQSDCNYTLEYMNYTLFEDLSNCDGELKLDVDYDASYVLTFFGDAENDSITFVVDRGDLQTTGYLGIGILFLIVAVAITFAGMAFAWGDNHYPMKIFSLIMSLIFFMFATQSGILYASEYIKFAALNNQLALLLKVIGWVLVITIVYFLMLFVKYSLESIQRKKRGEDELSP